MKKPRYEIIEDALEKVKNSVQLLEQEVQKCHFSPLNLPSHSLQPLERCLGHSSVNSFHVTESQSGRGSNGPLGRSNPPLKQVCLNQITQKHVQTGFESLPRRRIHRFSELPVPVLHCPQRSSSLHLGLTSYVLVCAHCLSSCLWGITFQHPSS